MSRTGDWNPQITLITQNSGTVTLDPTTEENYGTKTLTPDQAWYVSWLDLPTEVDGDDSREWYYYVKEATPGYITTIDNNNGIQSGLITVTNTKSDEPVTTSLTVSKAWANEDGSAGWPDDVSVTFTLMKEKNGTAIALSGDEQAAVKSANMANEIVRTFSAEEPIPTDNDVWKDLPLLANGYTYTAVETKIQKGEEDLTEEYTSTSEQAAYKDAEGKYYTQAEYDAMEDGETKNALTAVSGVMRITNRKEQTVTVSAKKTWENTPEKLRATAVQFTLYQEVPKTKYDGAGDSADKFTLDEGGDARYYLAVKKDGLVNPQVVKATVTTDETTTPPTVTYTWPDEATWDRLPKYTEGTESEAVYYVKETGVYYGDRSKLDDADEPATFADPHELDGFSVSGEGTVSFDAEGTGSVTIINDVEPIDIKVKKAWEDFSGSGYFWKIKFQLEYKETPIGELKGNADYAETLEAIDDAFITFSKADNDETSGEGLARRTFKDLPSFRVDEYGNVFAIEYSALESEYWVYEGTDENGTLIAHFDELNNTNPLGDKYSGDFDTDPTAENDYTMHVTNTKDTTIVGAKIDLGIEKTGWTEQGTNRNLLQEDDTWAEFTLRRFMHYEYRDYTDIAEDDDHKVTITVRDANEAVLNTLETYQGMEVSVMATFKTGADGNGYLEFSRSDDPNSSIAVYHTTSASKKELVRSATFIAAGNMTITLKDNSQLNLLADGAQGIQATDTITPTADTVDSSYTGPVFRLNNENSWKLTAEDDERLKDLPLISIKREGKQETITVYSYYFEETRSNPLGYNASYQDEAGNPVGRDNRLYVSSEVKAENHSTEAMHIIKKWYRLEDAIQPPVVVKVKENGRDLKSTGFSDNGVEVDYNEKYGGYVLSNENDWNVNFYGLDSGVRRDFIELGYLASPDAETVTPLPSDAFDAKHYWFGENDDDHPNESVYNELMPKITTNGGQNINKTTGTMFIYNVPHYIGYQPEFKKYWYGFNGHMQNEADYGSDGSVMFTVQIQQKARWMEDGEGHQAGDEITSVGEDGWVDYLQPFNVWYDHNTAAQQNYEDITNLADSWLVNVKEYNVAKWGFVDVGGGRYELVEYDYRFKELSVTDESGRTWTKDSAGIDDGSGKHRYDIFNFETGPLGLKKQWQLKGEVPAKVYFQVTQCDGGRMPDVAKFVYEDIQKARAKGETELEKALQYWNIRQDNVVEDEGQYYFVITSEDLASVQENENSGIIDWYIEIHNLDIFINGLEKNYGEATYEVHEAGYATKAAPNTFIPLGDAQDPWTCYYYRSVRGQSDQMVGATEGGIQIDNTVDPGTGAKKPVSYYKVVNTDVSTTEFTVEKTWPDEMQPDENTKIVLELQQRVADVDEYGHIKLNDNTVLDDLTQLQANLDKVVWKSEWTAAEYAHPNVLTLPTDEGKWTLTWEDLPLEKVVGVNKGSGSSNNMALLAPIFYRVVETSAPSWTDPNITVRVGDSEQKIAIGADSTYIGQGGVYSMNTGDYVADRLEQTIQNDAKSFELKVTKDWNDVNDTENETMSTWPAGYSVDYAVVRHAFEQKSHLINGEIIYSTGTEALENAFLDASGAWKVIDPETEKAVSNTGDTYATSVKVGGTDTPFKTGTLDSEHQSADKTTLPKLGELAKGGFITVMTTAEGSDSSQEVTRAVVYTYEVIETGGTRPANSSYSFPAVSAQVETEEQVEDPQNPSETVTQEIENPEAGLVNKLTDLEAEKKWYTKSEDGTVTEISAPAGNAGFKMTGKLYRSLTPADDDTFTVTFKNKWKLTSGAVVGGTEPGQTAPENGAIEVTITSDTTQRKYHLVLDDFENTIRLPKGSTYTVSYGSNDNVEKVTDDLNGAKISEDQATVNTEIEMAMTGPRIVIIVKGTPGNGFGITEISERTWDGNNANSAEKQPKDTSSIPNPITEAGTYVIPLEEDEIGKVFGIKLNNSGNVVAYGDAFFRTWSDYWLINTNNGAATIVLDFDPHYAEISIAINADGGYRCSDFGWNANYGDSGKTRGTEATKQIVQGATQRYTIESTVNTSSILVAGDISSYSVGQWTPNTGWPLYNSTYYSITVTITAADEAKNITLTITDPATAGTNATAAQLMAAPRMMAAPPVAVRSLAAPLRAASSSSDFTLVNDISMLPEDAEQVESFTLDGNVVDGEREDSPWHITWTDLPAADENGNPIYYYIVEDEVELPDSYSNAQSVTVEYVYDYVKKTETVHNEETGEDEEIEVVVALKKAVIGNTISTKEEHGSLIVTKELLGLPDSVMDDVSFAITVTGPSRTETGTLSAENGWTCTFDKLPVGSYTVQETTTGVEGYVWVEANSTSAVTAAVRADETTPVTLTNAYAKDVSFRKTWVNESGTWPTDEEITVEITRNVVNDGTGTVDDAFKLVYKAQNCTAVLDEDAS
ncbi:MAG: Cna B-type domain-containing protein, partial [Clostridia bacterium]|nr:Cna B-type domain-containing protein [Clostridia bacterium]